MKIEFKDKKMILTHPSGIVSIYDREYLEKFKKNLIKEKQDKELHIQMLTEDISKCR